MPPRTPRPPATTKSAEPDTSTGGALRVAAYCRYSEGPEQDDASIEAQHNAITREAHNAGNWLVTWYDEPRQTSYNVEEIADRPIFAGMLRDVEARKFDLVVCHKIDRWSRKLRISLQALEIVLSSRTNFRALADGINLDSISGWFQYSLMALLAEHYSRNLSHETKKGKAVRAQRGEHQSRPPFGYHVGADGIAEPSPDDWPGLQHLYSLMLSGATNMEAARAMNADGRWRVRGAGRGKHAGEVKDWSQEVVSLIRHNVFYRPFRPGDDRGTITYQGEEYRGKHQAACTWDDWHAMREVASGRRRGRAVLRHEPYTAEFRGIVACAGCGGRLYVARSIGEGYETQERYRCQRKPADGPPCVYAGQWARVEHVRAAWLDWADTHLVMPSSWEQIVRESVLRGESEAREDTDEVAAARERQRWKRRRDAAKALYLDGEIDRAEWERRAREADEALARLAAAARAPEQQVTRLIDAGHILTDQRSLWALATTQERQQMAQLLLEPLGLVVRPLGYRGLYSRWQTAQEQDAMTSCELVSVRLREPFRDLLATLHNAHDHAAG